MKCDVPLKNITYVSSFATAVTVTMVAKTTVLHQTPKQIIIEQCILRLILRLQSDLKNMGKLLLMEYGYIYLFYDLSLPLI